jgi:hypothetical protein
MPEIGEPARLEMFPDEFERLQAAERVVRLRSTPPGARKAQELTVLQEQFDVLAQGGDMRSILLLAITVEHERRGQEQAPGGRQRRGSGRPRARVDYSTLEHAGEPHRGRITEAEKQIIREHLDEVNRRSASRAYGRLTRPTRTCRTLRPVRDGCLSDARPLSTPTGDRYLAGQGAGPGSGRGRPPSIMALCEQPTIRRWPLATA